MLMNTAKLKKGAIHIAYDCEWKWTPDSQTLPELKRGHWRATDGTRIEIVPPSEGHDTWMITVPIGRGREMLMQLGDEEAVFHYGAEARKARAN